MEERGAPVRALDGAGPDLATVLPAQTPHRPTGGDKVNSQLNAPTDPAATAEAPPTAMADLADTDTWSTAEAEGTRSTPRERAEMAKQVRDTWSSAEASEVTFERTKLADPTDNAASDSRPPGPTGAAAETRLAEWGDGPAVESLPAGTDHANPHPTEARRGGGEPNPAEARHGDGERDLVEARRGDAEPDLVGARRGDAQSNPAEARHGHAEPHPAERPGAGVEPHVPDSEGVGEMPAPIKTARDHAESQPDAHLDGGKLQPYKLRRAAACAILFVAIITTLLGFLLVIAAGTEDSAIESHTGRADAEVLDVTAHRTLVRFQTPDGAEHVPNVGVLYPEALEEGQVVRVEYDLRDPDLVRVAGRGATLTFLPAFTTLFAVWTVSVGLVWWLRKPGPLHLRSLRARRKLAV